VKGDISTSLWTRRAILNALAQGGRLPATAPRAEAPVIVEEATATTPTPQGTTKEVEAVE